MCPVLDIAHIEARVSTALMLFCSSVIVGASSNRLLVIQEHSALAGRARVRYRRLVGAAIVSGRLQTIAMSSLRAGLNMLHGGLGGFFHKSMKKSGNGRYCTELPGVDVLDGRRVRQRIGWVGAGSLVGFMLVSSNHPSSVSDHAHTPGDGVLAGDCLGKRALFAASRGVMRLRLACQLGAQAFARGGLSCTTCMLCCALLEESHDLPRLEHAAEDKECFCPLLARISRLLSVLVHCSETINYPYQDFGAWRSRC